VNDSRRAPAVKLWSFAVLEFKRSYTAVLKLERRTIVDKIRVENGVLEVTFGNILAVNKLLLKTKILLLPSI